MTMTNWFLITTRSIGYPQPESNFAYITKTYDTSNACKTCNIGLTQKDEFRFAKEPHAKNNQFLGLNWVFDQVFVRQLVKDVFEQENVSGIDFSRPVLHKTSLPMDGIYQLRVNNLLTSGLLTENLNPEICELPKNPESLKFLTAIKSKLVEGPFCGQLKYNLPQDDNCLKIKSVALDGKPDFVRLGYSFGSGGNAQKPILVSERVKQLIDREKWRGVFLQPIELV